MPYIASMVDPDSVEYTPQENDCWFSEYAEFTNEEEALQVLEYLKLWKAIFLRKLKGYPGCIFRTLQYIERDHSDNWIGYIGIKLCVTMPDEYIKAKNAREEELIESTKRHYNLC